MNKRQHDQIDQGSNQIDQESNNKEAESNTREPNGAAQNPFLPGVRVVVKGRDGGMVAKLTQEGNLVIAMDAGHWVDVQKDDVPTHIAMEADGGDGAYIQGKKIKGVCVQGITYEGGSPKGAVTGALFGLKDETLFCGQASSYQIHWGKECSKRNKNKIIRVFKKKTFCMGDIVECKESGERAAVARVVYVPKSQRHQQAREMLLLLTLTKGEGMRASVQAASTYHVAPLSTLLPQPPCLMAGASNCDWHVNSTSSFFPASWANWDRIDEQPRNKSKQFVLHDPNKPCLKLAKEDIKKMNKVAQIAPPPSPV